MSFCPEKWCKNKKIPFFNSGIQKVLKDFEGALKNICKTRDFMGFGLMLFSIQNN